MAVTEYVLGTGNTYRIKLPEDAGATYFEVTDVNGNSLVKIYSDGHMDFEGGEVSNNSASLNSQTGTTYTLQSSDNGKVVVLTNASAIALTVADALPAGFHCVIIQGGAGQVTVSGQSTMNIRNRQSHTKLAGQYAMGSLFIIASNECILGGDTSA